MPDTATKPQMSHCTLQIEAGNGAKCDFGDVAGIFLGAGSAIAQGIDGCRSCVAPSNAQADSIALVRL